MFYVFKDILMSFIFYVFLIFKMFFALFNVAFIVLVIA